MQTCPRCHGSVAPEAAFCQHCGAQLRVQPVQGEIIDGTKRFARNRPINPGRAARLSIVPGLGHWYAGAPLKGMAFFAAILGPLVLGTELDLTVVGAAVATAKIRDGQLIEIDGNTGLVRLLENA